MPVFPQRLSKMQRRFISVQRVSANATMVGTDKSRGYCLEMICADFLAGANLENGNPEALLLSLDRLFGLLPTLQKQQFLEQVRKAS
jgi:hypothetical protein